MLQKLTIHNYAIIDQLEIDFSNKLNIITGETGAGKSIIAGALGLILGDRADTSILVNKEKKCIVEGLFLANAKREVIEFFNSNDLDFQQEILIRREIASNGKSRAFVNDTPLSLQQVRLLGSLMVDLHRQFDSLEIGENAFQEAVLDALAGHEIILEDYKKKYRKWQLAKSVYESLRTQKLQSEKEFDYNNFQHKELQDAGLKENELEDLEKDIKVLSNSEGIMSALSKLIYDVNESEQAIIRQLRQLTHQLESYSAFHPGLAALIQRVQSVQVELQDVAEEAARISSQITYDPRRIEEINERLSAGYRLQKKHGVRTTAELLEIMKQLEEKLQAVLNIDSMLEEKEKEAEELFRETEKLSLRISEGRKKQVKPLEKKVNELLRQVGMPNAALKVMVDDKPLSFTGADKVEFLFDANIARSSSRSREVKEDNFQPVDKVASGGELNRLMLCIKSLVAQSIDLPTMIFDEIDTGISGEAARQVAVILKGLASSRQIICITHQPQIAGKADAHFLVFKDIVDDRVKTSIRKLSADERITTIARMLSGEKPTAAAMENAREMLSN